MTQTTARLVITGPMARELAEFVRIYVQPERRGGSWTEVQGMRECRHGCKLHVRQYGAVRQYALLHQSAYGCVLGEHTATRTIKVHVRPRG